VSVSFGTGSITRVVPDKGPQNGCRRRCCCCCCCSITLLSCLLVTDYVNLTIYPICHRLFLLPGQRLNLTCEADRQLAAFSWTRRTISGCETAPLSEYDGFHVDSGDGSTSSRLIKTEVVHGDEGLYECSGSDGSHHGSYPLHVLVVNSTFCFFFFFFFFFFFVFLVVIAETAEDLIKRLNEWKNNVENRGMRVNMNKTKVMISGDRQKPV